MSESKWYYATSKDGKDGKIITNDEAQALSPNQRVGHLYTLSAALRDGLIEADLSQHTDLNELTFWHAGEKNEFGEIIHKGPKRFLTNQLRDVIQEKKKQLAQAIDPSHKPKNSST